MATQDARSAVETFLTWVQEQQRMWAENSSDRKDLSSQRFSSYGDAHREWLFYANGLEAIHHNYDLAVEALLVLIVRLDRDRPVDMPLAYPEPDSRSWDHMTESGFRRLVYGYQGSSLERAWRRNVQPSPWRFLSSLA